MLAQILDQIRIWVEEIIMALGYPGITLVMLVENLFPPIPSEVVMPFAGFLVASGRLSFSGIIIAGTIGALLGAVVLYYVGMHVRDTWLRLMIRRYGKFLLLSEQDFDRTLSSFDQYGEWYVLVGRVIPGVRSVISIPAGFKRMKFTKFLLFTTIGTVAWNLLLGTAGYALGRNWERILDLLSTYETVVWILIGGIVFGLAAYRLLKAPEQDAE